MDLTVCKDNINAFVVFKIWSCDYIKTKFTVRVRFVSQTDFGILFPSMHVVRWTFLEIHGVPLTCGLLVSCLLYEMTKYLCFSSWTWGKKKKQTSGKCVSFNRRLSVKGERRGIYSCFLSLDVTRLSNGACFPSNVAFLRGPQGRSWSPDLEAMVLFCCCVFGFGGNWQLYLPLWGQLDAFLCEGPGGEREKRPSLESGRGFAGSGVYGHTDVSIHSVLLKTTEWESNTVARGRFRVAKDKRLTLKHKMKWKQATAKPDASNLIRSIQLWPLWGSDTVHGDPCYFFPSKTAPVYLGNISLWWRAKGDPSGDSLRSQEQPSWVLSPGRKHPGDSPVEAYTCACSQCQPEGSQQ